jgi:gliding motility-associated-like protein
MLLKRFFSLVLICISLQAHATHNRSGEITYKHLYGNTYEFTITTCTKLTSEANRADLEIQYGDGVIDTIPRVVFYDYPATDTKQNYYVGTHTYTGPGTFLIQCEDPNRNANVLNIANSVDKIFCIQTLLIISPFLGTPNNSLQLVDCPCPEETCTGQPWIYNFGAYDPDGDSLSYQLIPCKGEDCFDMSIPDVYQFPQEVGGGLLTLDAITGTLFWNAPTISGEYNLAVVVTEYRRGIRIGFVIRDMQVTVKGVCLNNAPAVSSVNDTCVFANENVDFQAYAQDDQATVQDNPILHWEYFGEGFFLENNPATFATSPNGNPITGDFHWQPGCEAVRNNSYIFTLEATDAGPNVILKDLETFNITVNAPPVQNLTLTESLNAFELNWDAADCPQVVGYKLYKSNDSIALNPENCCTPNFPLSIGYSLLAEVDGKQTTTFTDSINLVVGNQYCYLVTAVFQNGAESCISNQVCGEMNFQIPVLTHATIGFTDPTLGVDTVRWTHPKELDLNVYGGPYQYRLYQSTSNALSFEPVFTTAPQNSLTQCDTFFINQNLPTSSNAFQYKVALINNGQELGFSPTATTIFLSLVPNDNQLQLVWNEIVPWTNSLYEIWKESPTNSGNFVLLDIISEKSYIDSNLLNETSYCYKVRSIGAYSLPGIVSPLLNWSNIACAQPTDLTPPCAPTLGNLTQNCETFQNSLFWDQNPAFCAEDVVGYRVYYSPTTDGDFEVITDFSASSTGFIFSDTSNLAGCFYLTAYDSLPNQNESVASNLICVENCEPLYELPNVFTPNDDNNNDVFHPLLPYKFIDAVDLVILNRWGNTIFETKDPMIGWNGKDQKTGEWVTEGVYTYLCKVKINTLSGEKWVTLHGFVHVIFD